jgi:hypothetical protein
MSPARGKGKRLGNFDTRPQINFQNLGSFDLRQMQTTGQTRTQLSRNPPHILLYNEVNEAMPSSGWDDVEECKTSLRFLRLLQ